MKMNVIFNFILACGIACLLALPAAAKTDQELSQEDRIGALERKVEVLISELERTRTDMAVPEDPELESVFGMGPGASKIYSLTRGLSIGGYAEGLYTAIVDDKRESGATNRADFLRAVLYAGYKFTDNIIYNMEIEFEHATTSSTDSSGSGSASIEFAALDFLWKPELNARAGILLAPMGFLNEMHEPPFYYGTHRPDAETRIIPSTWRENGVGIFGQIAEELDYKLYVMNGFNARGFDERGLRGGRQKGNRALAEHLGFVGRLDWTPAPGLLLGGSVYVGSAGQDQDITVKAMDDVKFQVELPDVQTTIWEIHGQFEMAGLHTRALFTMAHLEDAAALSRALAPTDSGGTGDLEDGQAVARRMLGLYVEVGYEVLQWLLPESQATLEPFFRYEFVDTQNEMPSGFERDRSQVVNTYTAGLHFKPIPNVVVKLDYRNRSARARALGDEVNAGIGVVF
ncbi:MAG: hypothetical protein O7B23_12395 [Deltaproteobacteria bacterium]|nr:hypothetical protein [Deltaproteobacteria bacterium]